MSYTCKTTNIFKNKCTKLNPQNHNSTFLVNKFINAYSSTHIHHNLTSYKFNNANHLKAIKSDDTIQQTDANTLQIISDLSSNVDDQWHQIINQHTNLSDNIKQQPIPSSLQNDLNSLLRNKIIKAIYKLQDGLLEREIEVRLLLLAALCGEHLLLLGPPGTAKSELSRRLSSLCGGKYFERLLTRFSVPEELFGPLSMKGLENDEYIRQIEGYLPTAEVAFIDEIFKANSAILNALLTLLNERLFDNGNARIKSPLLCLVFKYFFSN